jgi:ribosome-binding factor A
MSNSSNAPTQRQLRVGEQLRHLITDTLQRGKFHNLVLLDHAPSVTVTEVKVAPDLKYAKAFVMSLRGNNMDELLPALNECAGYFQKEIARQMTTKFTPRIKFVTDETFDHAEHIGNILHNLPKAADQEE